MKMRKILKGKKGVTLVALVVTVIVLLILAAITINLTIGENGIITTAKQAGKNYQEATNIEQNILADFWSGADETIGSAVSAQNSRGVGNAVASDLLVTKTAYVNGEFITGTMANFSNTRVNQTEESKISKEDEYTYINIPETGYYDVTSQIGVATESLLSVIDPKRDWQLVLSVKVELREDYAWRGSSVVASKTSSIVITCENGVTNVNSFDSGVSDWITENNNAWHYCGRVSSVTVTSFTYLN